MQFLHSKDVISAVCYKVLPKSHCVNWSLECKFFINVCEIFLEYFLVLRRKAWFISADFADSFYLICGIIWIVDRFMLLVYMYFGDKESISLDADFLY